MERFTINATLIIQFACSLNSLHNLFFYFPWVLQSPTLSPAEAPAGYPNNCNNGKTESPRGTMGRGKRQEPLFSLSPFHRAPRAFYFFLPASLRHKEASAQKRGRPKNTEDNTLRNFARQTRYIMGYVKWRIEENICLTF